MRNTNLKFLMMFLIIFGVPITVSPIKTRTYAANNLEITTHTKFISDYIEHEPMEITDNAGLATYSSSGTGLVDDPYIISGYNFTVNDSYGIYIYGSSITAHFIIENCYFNTSSYGIQINNIANNIFSIRNNIFEDCFQSAVFIKSTSGFVLENNTFLNVSKAIDLSNVEEFTVKNNNISYTGIGIDSEHTEILNISCVIQSNTFKNISGSAIYIKKHSTEGYFNDSILIMDNDISNASKGIVVLISANAIITNNTLTDCQYSIHLYSYYDFSSPTKYIISGNVIKHNSYSSILIEYNINGLIIENNEFIDNKKFDIIGFSPKNLTIRENNFSSDNSSGTVIDVYNPSNATIINNYMVNRKIHLTHSSNVHIANNTLVVNTNVDNSIRLDSGENITIFNNKFSQVLDTEGIAASEIANLNISNNIFNDIKTAVNIYAANGGHLDNISILNNFFNNIAGAVKLENSGDVIVNGFIIKNNTIVTAEEIEDPTSLGAIIIEQGGIKLHITNNTIKVINNIAIGISEQWDDMLISKNTIIVRKIDYEWACGIFLYYHAKGGLISNNTFIEDLHNKIGACFIAIRNGVESLNIYYNSFFSLLSLNNKNTIDLVVDDGTNNTWYNSKTSVGNYWSNYVGYGSYKIQGTANSEDLYPITYDDNDGDGLDDILEQYIGTNPTVNDTDGDGMPDGWETSYGFNPLTNDANFDNDTDNLTNLQEYQYHTDPFVSDTDGDGMPDGYEASNALNPLINDASEDLDGDGLTNIEEYYLGTKANDVDTDNDGWTDKQESDAGTDPLDPNNHPPETTIETPFGYILGFIGIITVVLFINTKRRTC